MRWRRTTEPKLWNVLPTPGGNDRLSTMPIAERLLPVNRNLLALFPLLLALALSRAASAQISLATAVDLAEKSSPAVRSAEANVRKAVAASQEARDVYVPNFVGGGSPGYFYGFPMGYPSLFNVQTSSLVLSFSQRDYLRSADAALAAANLNLKDTRQQVALDTSLEYVELDHDLSEVAALSEEKSFAETLVSIERDRVGAGVDPRVDELQAELTAAQVDEKRIHLENDAEDMRQKIAHLTGLPADGLTAVSSSIPGPPSLESLGSGAANADNNSGIAAAYASAKSKLFLAWGDARANYRPYGVFGGQYSRFATFNNYSEYFQHFQYNNFGAGVQITIPLFDAVRRAKARESAADAVAAEAQADQTRDTLNEQTLQARRAIEEISAEQKVAEIQSELAQEQLKTVDAELTSGPGVPGAQPVAPSAAQRAHIDEREKYEDLLDANFSLMKVELNLLRMTGQIEDWVHASLK
jgi:outer membrane protein TolC